MALIPQCGSILCLLANAVRASTLISRPQAPIIPVSRPSFCQVPPGMRSIHLHNCHSRGCACALRGAGGCEPAPAAQVHGLCHAAAQTLWRGRWVQQQNENENENETPCTKRKFLAKSRSYLSDSAPQSGGHMRVPTRACVPFRTRAPSTKHAHTRTTWRGRGVVWCV